jgi:hypothetical protein
MKISDWIKANTESHAIQDDFPLSLSFKEATGFDAPWSNHSIEATRELMEDRGLGGTLNAKAPMRLAYGYEIAIACARTFADGYSRTKHGRGSAYWEAVDALVAAGK